MEELRRELCVRGHHIYKEIWNPAIGEVVQCKREPRNAADRYSVVVRMTLLRFEVISDRHNC